MPTFTQDKLPIRVDTELGTDALLLQGFTGQEGVSMPFSFTLDLQSEDAGIDGKRLLRTPASVTLKLADGSKSVFHGLIRRFVQLGRAGDLTAYRADLVPWLWFLSLSSDCRVFQEKTVLEIVEEIFGDLGWSDFDIRCRKSYPKREFCVQYRETHLDFVTRLLEEEGIFYFFEHSSNKHVLVLADGSAEVQPCPGQPSARLASRGGTQEEDTITDWEHEYAFRPGKVTLRDYDFQQPSHTLESGVGDGPVEIYVYPGDFTDPSEGDRYARLRLEECEVAGQVVHGDSGCRAFRSGYRFDLKDHYHKDLNGTYQLLQVHHSARAGDYTTGGEQFDYQNSFEAIPHDVPFRPPRTALKPVMQGSQTAVVVGKSGEEIWVDKHGRVKVQFHWDRKGQKNENSSCWVRVATSWAGKNWGAIQIPRIGQEVIVEFLEGDPDKPVITGRLWNADQTPPYTLPANQTQSGVKSRSSKGGGADNANEIRFEDKKGSEHLLVHAEKDFQLAVEHDEQHTVGNNRTIKVEKDDTRTVSRGDDALTLEQGKQTIVLQMGDQEITLKQGDQKITLDMGNVTTKTGLGKISNEAMQGIEFKVGQSSIKLDQTGVTIKGMNVSIEGQIQAEMKGVMTTVKGDGLLTVKGAITMIN